MELDNLQNINYHDASSTRLSLDDLIIILKYPELINKRESTPETDIKLESISIGKTISERLKKNSKDSFKMRMRLLSLEPNPKYKIKYKTSLRGNKLGEITLKTAEGSLNMGFQTMLWKGELAVLCIPDFTPPKMGIDKKIELLKKLHEALKTFM